MDFDEASSKEGLGAGVLLISPSKETNSLSYKLEFENTNNVAEYEVFILGLEAANKLKIKNIHFFEILS
jgi:ribonuclease HI